MQGGCQKMKDVYIIPDMEAIDIPLGDRIVTTNSNAEGLHNDGDDGVEKSDSWGNLI